MVRREMDTEGRSKWLARDRGACRVNPSCGIALALNAGFLKSIPLDNAFCPNEIITAYLNVTASAEVSQNLRFVSLK